MAIVMLGILHSENSVLKQEKCFCLLFIVCNFSLSVQLYFIIQQTDKEFYD